MIGERDDTSRDPASPRTIKAAISKLKAQESRHPPCKGARSLDRQTLPWYLWDTDFNGPYWGVQYDEQC
jgi:hypothetical protein